MRKQTRRLKHTNLFSLSRVVAPHLSKLFLRKDVDTNLDLESPLRHVNILVFFFFFSFTVFFCEYVRPNSAIRFGEGFSFSFFDYQMCFARGGAVTDQGNWCVSWDQVQDTVYKLHPYTVCTVWSKFLYVWSGVLTNVSTMLSGPLYIQKVQTFFFKALLFFLFLLRALP